MSEPIDEVFEPLRSSAVLDYDKLAHLTSALQEIGKRIVVTIGSYDDIHEGHMRYLYRARSHGDFLVVGLDSDRAIKRYKGEHRPLVSEMRRLECVLHNWADFATLIDDVDESGNWGFELLKRVQPDVFVAVEDSYPKEQLEAIEQLCGRLVISERQAETSTSEQIRQAAIMMNQGAPEILRRVADAIENGDSLDLITRTEQ